MTYPGEGLAQYPPGRKHAGSAHSVDLVRYTAENGPCSLRCACGVQLAAACPIELDAAFRAHRKALGLRVNVTHDRSIDW